MVRAHPIGPAAARHGRHFGRSAASPLQLRRLSSGCSQSAGRQIVLRRLLAQGRGPARRPGASSRLGCFERAAEGAAAHREPSAGGMAPRLHAPRVQQPGAAAAAAAQPPPPPPDPALATALKALMLRHWGHSEFRPLQAEAVNATLQGKDALVILPTGAAGLAE